MGTSFLAIETGLLERAAHAPMSRHAGSDRATRAPCLGFALTAGLVSWLAVGSLIGLILA
jgi:hypothetical protein